jgi:hypothetical protein
MFTDDEDIISGPRAKFVLCCSFRSEVYICNVLLKAKFTLEQATKAQRGSRGLVLPFIEPRH